MEFSTDMTVQCGSCERKDRCHSTVNDWGGFSVQSAFLYATDYFLEKGWIKKADDTWECPWHTGTAARRAA